MFYKNKRGWKDMYDIRLREKKQEITSVIKWGEKGYDVNEFNWQNIFDLPFKVIPMDTIFNIA